MNKIENKGWNWAAVPADVFLSARLNHADVRVYAYLQWRAGKKELAWPSVETIANELHMGNSSVSLALRHLVSEGWIERKRKFGGSSTTYILENPKMRTSNPLEERAPRTSSRVEDVPLAGERTVLHQARGLNKSHNNKAKEPPDASAAASELSKLYEANIGAMTPILLDELNKAITTYGKEITAYGITQAAKAGARRWAYAEKVMERVYREGYSTKAPRKSTLESIPDL